MKVLHILYSGLGGHANVFFSFIKADEKHKYAYEALFAGDEKIREEYVAKCNMKNIPWKYVAKKTKFDFNFSRKFVSAIRKSEAKIILVQGSRFILLAKLAVILSSNKKKLVIVDTQANNLKTKAEWVWLFLSLFLANKVVFLTEYFGKEVKNKFGWIYNPKKISIINNGIDLDQFKPATTPPVKKEIHVGMQSRIVPIKDHRTLLEAFSLLCSEYSHLNLHLRIAGDGKSLEDLQQLAKKLKIQDQVTFTGMLNEKKLIEFLQSLDIYVHASFGEAMSTAIMQAMACKLPVIASDVIGINNMIENNITGILVPVKDANALKESILELINNPEVADQISQNAWKFANEHYGNNVMFEKYARCFEEII